MSNNPQDIDLPSEAGDAKDYQKEINQNTMSGNKDIIKLLEEQNPFTNPSYNPMYSDGYLNCISKLREILSSKQDEGVEEAAKAYADKFYPIKDYDCYESDYDYRTQCAKNKQIQEHFLAGHNSHAQAHRGQDELWECLREDLILGNWDYIKSEYHLTKKK